MWRNCLNDVGVQIQIWWLSNVEVASSKFFTEVVNEFCSDLAQFTGSMWWVNAACPRVYLCDWRQGMRIQIASKISSAVAAHCPSIHSCWTESECQPLCYKQMPHYTNRPVYCLRFHCRLWCTLDGLDIWIKAYMSFCIIPKSWD
jgi:hypothetical protein